MRLWGAPAAQGALLHRERLARRRARRQALKRKRPPVKLAPPADRCACAGAHPAPQRRPRPELGRGLGSLGPQPRKAKPKKPGKPKRRKPEKPKKPGKPKKPRKPKKPKKPKKQRSQGRRRPRKRGKPRRAREAKEAREAEEAKEAREKKVRGAREARKQRNPVRRPSRGRRARGRAWTKDLTRKDRSATAQPQSAPAVADVDVHANPSNLNGRNAHASS